MEKHESKDWQVGDLALCVHPGPWYTYDGDTRVSGPRAGGVYTVASVELAEHPLGGLTPVLGFPEWPATKWSSVRFVKVTPPALDDEREVADLLDQTA